MKLDRGITHKHKKRIEAAKQPKKEGGKRKTWVEVKLGNAEKAPVHRINRHIPGTIHKDFK
jgi:hypothetical protein